MGALMAGQGVNEVAKTYRLPKSTVSTMARKAGLKLEQLRAKKGENLDNLIADYLIANLTALKAQCVVFADPEYLRQQSASENATLHGVMTDKAVRLLEAASAGAAGPPAEDEPTDEDA